MFWYLVGKDGYMPIPYQVLSKIIKIRAVVNLKINFEFTRPPRESTETWKDLIGNWHIPLFSHWILQHAIKCPSSRLIKSFFHKISWSPTFISEILLESAYKNSKNCLLDGGPQKYDTFCNCSNVSKIQLTVSHIDELNYWKVFLNFGLVENMLTFIFINCDRKSWPKISILWHILRKTYIFIIFTSHDNNEIPYIA